jgi:dihydrofolate synthase/folylpolyglutamate synthase
MHACLIPHLNVRREVGEQRAYAPYHLVFCFVRQVAVIEVGLGGRFDATNVITPVAGAITTIGFDHQQHLGSTLGEIAFEKAGIIKRGRPVVVAPQPPDALAVFEARAAELEAPLSRYGQEWTVARRQNDLVFTDRLGERKLPLPALPGAHQIPNAGAALACLPFLEGFCIDGHAQMRGLSEVQWPARLQRLTRGPLARSLPPGCELWLDGGHNESAGAALADFLGTQRQKDGPHPRPLHLIFGMLNTKDPVAFLKPLAPLTRDLQAVQIAGHSSLERGSSSRFPAAMPVRSGPMIVPVPAKR